MSRLSHYLSFFPYPLDPDYRMVFSSKRCSLVLLPEESLLQLDRGRGGQELHGTMSDLEILVKDQQQEKAETLAIYKELNRLNGCLEISVILGLECNFACPYCYEGSMKGHQTMSDEILAQSISFIKECFRPGQERLKLALYGGETLLYSRQVRKLCTELKPYIEERGAEFECAVVSNGSLLTPDKAKEFVVAGVTYIKITLDGPPETHNVTRPFTSGQPSFDVVLKNIKACCDIIPIGIGGNFTKENYHLFPKLLDILDAEGLTPDRLAQVKFDAVMQTNDRFSSSEFRSGCASIDEPWLTEAFLELRGEILKRGYNYPELRQELCAIEVENNFSIHYDGSLYKCAILAGHDEFKAGDVWKGPIDYSQTYQVGHWMSEEKCQECTYLPLCSGGCRYAEYQRSGTMGKVDCRKEFLDRTLETMLLQDLKYRYGMDLP